MGILFSSPHREARRRKAAGSMGNYCVPVDVALPCPPCRGGSERLDFDNRAGSGEMASPSGRPAQADRKGVSEKSGNWQAGRIW